MHIIVDCPECQSRFQLHADLRGRRIRCPNSACRATFIVAEAKPARAPEPTEPSRKSEPSRSKSPKTDSLPTGTEGDVFDWRSAPPPVQGIAESTTSPPVAAPAPAAPKARPTVVDEPPPRRGWVVAVTMIAATFALLGGGAWYVMRVIGRGEETLRTEAQAEYTAGRFRPAAQKYRTLAEKFGATERGPEYRVLADLSDVRDQASGTDADAALKAAEKFDQDNGRNPAFQSHRAELGASALTIAVSLVSRGTDAAKSPEDAANALALFASAEQALALVRRYPPKDGDPAAIQSQIDRAKTDMAAAQERREHVAAVLALLRGDKPDIRAAELLALRHRVADDASVIAAVRAAEQRLFRVVPYEPLDRQAVAAAPKDGPPSVLLETIELPPKPGASEVVLAAARGLLSAHDSRDGRRLWTTRVGLDAGELPVRVPARGDEPELVIVAMTDPPGVTAREVRTGTARWHQPLEAPALGRPALQASGRLFVPTSGPRGIVYDLDARSGLLRGRFETGQPLAAGGAYDSLMGRLYVPAREQFVYVFGYQPVTQVAGPSSPTGPRCEGLLPTGHPPGSLRGEPIVVSGEEGVEVPRYLVLGVTDGFDAMKLRAYRLLDKPAQSAAQAEVRIRGWSWFPPYHDPEKVVLVTDAGAVGLFGINQAGTTDQAIFPLLGRDPPAAGDRSTARGLLAHAEEFGFWALAGGTVQHWRLGLTREQGRVLKKIWDSPPLGSPLHGAQVSADRSTLFLVTQTSSPTAFRASAVDADKGRVMWQRPLGVSPQGDPLEVGHAVIVLDASGAIDRFDPTRHPVSEAPWQSGGRRIAAALPEAIGTPTLFRAADGRGAVALTCSSAPGGALRLVVRQIDAEGDVRESVMRLPSMPFGTPALDAIGAVLPLADGTLARAVFTGVARIEEGPNWRPRGASSDSRGHVLPWRNDEYLVSDGNRRLLSLRWPVGQKFALDTTRSLELPARIVGSPIRLPGDQPSAAVADASGTLTWVVGATPKAARTWSLGGSVTAGPWSIGDKVACVVGRKTLVWIDPQKDGSAWRYETAGDGIEFAPVLVDGSLVVADAAGLFMSLDPATGSPRGPGFRHPAEVAPASAVAPFGPGRLFAPLTDGSALLLPMPH